MNCAGSRCAGLLCPGGRHTGSCSTAIPSMPGRFASSRRIRSLAGGCLSLFTGPLTCALTVCRRSRSDGKSSSSDHRPTLPAGAHHQPVRLRSPQTLACCTSILAYWRRTAAAHPSCGGVSLRRQHHRPGKALSSGAGRQPSLGQPGAVGPADGDGLLPRMVTRGASTAIYFKQSEHIEDLSDEAWRPGGGHGYHDHQGGQGDPQRRQPRHEL